jgi:uncharacterized protein
VTPAVQTSWGYDQFFRHAGVGAGLPHTLEITALRTMISAGLFPEANFDPVPAWQQLRQPVLAEWGELDRVALPRESSTAIEEALRRGGNTRYTMRFTSGVRHNLNLTADGGFDRITSLPADYGTYERHWIDDLAGTEPSRLGTPPPTGTPPPVLVPLSGAATFGQLSVILALTMVFASTPSLAWWATFAGAPRPRRWAPRGLEPLTPCLQSTSWPCNPRASSAFLSAHFLVRGTLRPWLCSPVHPVSCSELKRS